MIDSGAGFHVSPPDYAEDYPIIPIAKDSLQLATVKGDPIQIFGCRIILIEVLPEVFVWIRTIVCTIQVPIWSVHMLNEMDHSVTLAGSNSHIGFQKACKAPIQNSDRGFFFTPYRVVSKIQLAATFQTLLAFRYRLKYFLLLLSLQMALFR